MNVTQPQIVSSTSSKPDKSDENSEVNKSESSVHSINSINSSLCVTSTNSNTPQNLVSQNAIDMLSTLFPHRKRSVLELVLRRCDLDLLRAIEQCSKTQLNQMNQMNQNASQKIDKNEKFDKFEVQSAFRPISSTSGLVPVTQAIHTLPSQNPSNYSSLIGELILLIIYLKIKCF